MRSRQIPGIGSKLIRLKSTDSTNERLRELFEAGTPEGTAVVAEHQTHGRGRHGRAWASPRGGLYLSVLLHPAPARASFLTLLAGLAPMRAMVPLGLQTSLKWPNDVLLQGRKVGGILGEGVYRRDEFALVLGLGINTNVPEEKLPRNQSSGVTSLSAALGHRIDQEAFLTRLLKELDAIYANFLSGEQMELLREYRQLCSTLGQPVEARTGGGKVRGTAVDVTDRGFLLVEDEEGELHEIVDATLKPLP